MTRRFVVIGAGVAGLAAARALEQGAPDAEVVVVERDTRVGGLVGTERTPDGFLLEWGPDSLLAGKPAGMRAIAEVGLSDEVQRPPPGYRRSFVAREGQLFPLPPGLISGNASITAMMSAPLFSFAGRARMALEPFVPRRRALDDESVASFFERRFGREMVDRLVDPVFRGVYSTPTDRLSLGAVMPHLQALERKHGSLARAMANHASLSGTGTSMAPMAVSLKSGMGSLPEALAQSLALPVRLGVSATGLRRTASGISIALGEHGQLEADGIVLATPAPVAARLLAELDRDLGEAIGRIELGRLDTVTFAFRREDVPHPLEGTGFVVDSTQKQTLTACTWSSSKWPGRAPENTALLRCFLSAPDASDEELVEAARADLRDFMGIQASPTLVRVFRRTQSLPRYEVGHIERAATILEGARQLQRIALAGNSYGGMGVPDCIDSGVTAAARLLADAE